MVIPARGHHFFSTTILPNEVARLLVLPHQTA
jgi:hypothetical protein